MGEIWQKDRSSPRSSSLYVSHYLLIITWRDVMLLSGAAGENLTFGTSKLAAHRGFASLPSTRGQIIDCCVYLFLAFFRATLDVWSSFHPRMARNRRAGDEASVRHMIYGFVSPATSSWRLKIVYIFKILICSQKSCRNKLILSFQNHWETQLCSHICRQRNSLKHCSCSESIPSLFLNSCRPVFCCPDPEF